MFETKGFVFIRRPNLPKRLSKMLRVRRCRPVTVIKNLVLILILLMTLYELSVHVTSYEGENANDAMSKENLSRELSENKSADSAKTEEVSVDESDILILGADDIYEIQSGRISETDIRLLEYIRRLTIGPSGSDLNLTDPTKRDHSQVEQAMFVDYALGYREGGFFIECGAGDGEIYSNSLYFERERGWTGLLIEPHPGDYQKLLGKRRKSYSLNACVSPGNHSSLQKFRAASGFISGLYGYVDNLHSGADFRSNWWFQRDMVVQCFPLTSILLALNVKHVDYLSIDIEGPEVEVLRTIPFDTIRIDAITVEYRAKGDNSDLVARSMNKLAMIRQTIQSTGLYDEIGILPPLKIFNRNQAIQGQAALEKTGLDVVFRRKDIRESTNY